MRCLTIIYRASLVETIEVTVRVIVRIMLCLTEAAKCIVAIVTTETTEVLVTTIALVCSRWCRSCIRWFRLRVSRGLLSFYASDTTALNRVLYSIFVSYSKASL